MNDWLSEIVEASKRNHLWDSQIERMVRVIREMAAYIMASHAVERACLEFGPVDIAKLENDRLNAWDNLSDDAKELLK